MAAHLEGKGIGIIDQAGLAQKGGAVYSHIRIANKPEDIHAIRVAAGECDLVLGGDMVVVGNKKVLSTAKLGATTMVINTAEILPGDFTRNADFSLPTERLKRAIRTAAGAEKIELRRRDAACDRAARQLDRREHLHGRLRLSARRAAAVGGIDRARDRAQRRSGADESGRVPVRAPRRVRSRVGRGADQARAGSRQRCAAAVAILRRDRGAPRRVPHRLPERRLCGALPGAGRQGAGGRSREGAGQDRASPTRSRAICSS